MSLPLFRLQSSFTREELLSMARADSIAVTKANIQSSQALIDGMNFLNTQAEHLNHHPEIAETIRLSERDILDAREALRCAPHEHIPACVTRLQHAILIHEHTLEKMRVLHSKGASQNHTSPDTMLHDVKQAFRETLCGRPWG